MKVLAIEPYYGGSHRAFLDGWIARSCHQWTTLTCPAHGWKWRMRHSGMSIAGEVQRLVDSGQRWDLVFCTDMLPLAEFVGLAPEQVRVLPRVIYFHENQFTYPISDSDRVDVHFGLTNMSAALAADSVWFNSLFHKDQFLQSLDELLRKMRSPRMLESVTEIAEKSLIHYPGIDPVPVVDRSPGPLRILWSARWEYDKNAGTFFDALELLESSGVDFGISVIGQRFESSPGLFDQAHKRWSGRIDRWGFQKTREEYISALQEADVVVSTAEHEFFGIAMVEAATAGVYPLLPERLAYPEVFQIPEQRDHFYDGSAEDLAGRLQNLALDVERGKKLSWCSDDQFARWRNHFDWHARAVEMDDNLKQIALR